MGGSIGKSKSQNTSMADMGSENQYLDETQSSSGSEYGQDVWGGQSQALQDLYSNASNLFGGMNNAGMDRATQNLSGYNQGLMDRGMAGQDYQMGGGSFGDTTDVRNKLMDSMGQPSQMGQMYNSIVGGEGNTYIDPMVDAMKQGAMENNAMMQSGTAMDAAAMGQGGSSRHAMQNAMTNKATNQQMLDAETMMRGGAYDKDLAMKMDIAGMADQNRQLEQDRMMGMMSGSDANRRYGMDAGAMNQNLGMGSMAPWMQNQNQQWNNMDRYAGVIGGPTVIGGGSQFGNSTGTSSGSGSSTGQQAGSGSSKGFGTSGSMKG